MNIFMKLIKRGSNSDFLFSCEVLQPCQTVIVKVRIGVLDEGVSMEGIYQLSTEVNGKESWTTSSNAIWYAPDLKDWLIGSLAKRGTRSR